MTRGSRGYADRGIGAEVLAELVVRQSVYANRAERYRGRQRCVNPVSSTALTLAKLVLHYQAMADDYARLIETVKEQNRG